ncbi:hypothetical protein, partial [Halobacillus sp. BBL2006]|uniref:hypothetical protein n=1 Tax=Halobacillus sp. BBL2006 TaxID=1543706 RepID=UPI001E4F8B01
ECISEAVIQSNRLLLNFLTLFVFSLDALDACNYVPASFYWSRGQLYRTGEQWYEVKEQLSSVK